jgi:hypothetical protein
MGFVIVMQVALVQLGGAALNTAPLPLAVWFRVILLGASTLVVGEVLRAVQRSMAKPATVPATA